VNGRYRGRNMAWSALLDLRDRVDNALENFSECDRLIIVIADVHRVATGMDCVCGQ
jgi:hypothetical protein